MIHDTDDYIKIVCELHYFGGGEGSGEISPYDERYGFGNGHEEDYGGGREGTNYAYDYDRDKYLPTKFTYSGDGSGRGDSNKKGGGWGAHSFVGISVKKADGIGFAHGYFHPKLGYIDMWTIKL